MVIYDRFMEWIKSKIVIKWGCGPRAALHVTFFPLIFISNGLEGGKLRGQILSPDTHPHKPRSGSHKLGETLDIVRLAWIMHGCNFRPTNFRNILSIPTLFTYKVKFITQSYNFGAVAPGGILGPGGAPFCTYLLALLSLTCRKCQSIYPWTDFQSLQYLHIYRMCMTSYTELPTLFNTSSKWEM